MENNEIKCPYCQSDKVRRHNYGHHFAEDESKYITIDHIGDEDSPKFRCDNCGRNFGEADDSDKN